MEFSIVIYYCCSSVYSLGPLAHLWTMHYEAKHSYFKSFSSRTSFKNVALSLARHHQRWMASNVASAQENKSFFKIEFECSKKGNRTLRLVVSINFVCNTNIETNVDQTKAVSLMIKETV